MVLLLVAGLPESLARVVTARSRLVLVTASLLLSLERATLVRASRMRSRPRVTL